MGQILKPRNSPDFIWRVDWRLRPEASASQLSMSIDMAQDFYFFRALPWHRLALMKARVIAGDEAVGKAFLQNITPFIWRQNLDFRALDELAHLKSRINLEHPALRQQRAAPEPITDDAVGFNVKLGSGGIREIEFIANAQQLVWGGKQYELRTPNTLEALEELVALGHMDGGISAQLSSSYIRLRQLENVIQMLGNEQTHIVPASDTDRETILTLLGKTDWPSFCEEVKSIRRFVNNLLNALIPPLLHSPHMTILLEQSPHIIDVFLSPQNGLDTAFIFSSDDYETRLERLRRFVNENLFVYYTVFMSEGGTAIALQKNLTALADATIDAALKIVADDLKLDALTITVLGLGKMGTSRMAPLSDIDLVFIFEDETDPDVSQKIVRRLRTALTTKLSEGIAYELDMRLRPSGRSGPPAVKLSSFIDHHESRAHNWEHIALAHSRIVAGDARHVLVEATALGTVIGAYGAAP